ncbi:MFS transporter [bacterium]|nr:MAG: MFS transporter [bacterium]
MRPDIALMIAVFLDLLGFGMIVTNVQLHIESLVPKGFPAGPVIGAVLASTFVVQTLVSPRWGEASDRIGRKPVVVICSVLSAVGMLVYGFSVNLPLAFLSRIFSGLGAANVAVAQAMLSDEYEGEARTAALGRLSAALSAGLIIGPILGGQLAKRGHALTFGLLPDGAMAVGVVGGIASMLGALVLFLALPNVPPKEARQPGAKRMVFDVALLKDVPAVRPLILMAAIAWFSLAMLEGTFLRLINRLFGYDEDAFGFIFGYESLLGVVIQGVAIGWLARKFGDRRLLVVAYLAQGLGLALNPFAGTLQSFIWPLATLFVASTLFAFGTGVANPTIGGLASKAVPSDRQGELFGLLQAARSIGFVLGPILGGALFDVHPAWPYYLAGLVCVGAALVVSRWSEAKPTGTVNV